MSNDPEEDAARQNYKRLFPDKTKSSDDEENAERLNPTPIFPGRKPLSDNQPSISSKEEGLEWVNGQYGTINIRGAFKILQEHPDGTVEFKEKKAFVDDLEHIRIKVKDPETDKTKLVPITDLWNKWIEKRRYPHGSLLIRLMLVISMASIICSKDISLGLERQATLRHL